MDTTNWKEYVFSLLTPHQRIELAQELWDSVADDARATSLSEAQVSELRRRVAEADAGRMPRHPWEEVRQRLLDRRS